MIRTIFLWPWSVLFGLILKLRHGLYDTEILKSEPGALPTLVLGNLTVGGTGKTPLTELLVLELEKILGEGHVGILSRGYGRQTKGFRWVSESDFASIVGDEPLMLRRKLPHVPVAVCENRLAGLRKMRDEEPDLQWVVCDDALQHRQLKPTIALLVLDSTQPIKKDRLLPLGRLRDLPSRMTHADGAIVTRLPFDASGTLEMALKEAGWPLHRVHFGTSMQAMPLRTWPDNQPAKNGLPGSPPAQRERILTVAGIARPERFMERLTERFQVVRREAHTDHKQFSEADVKRWKTILDSDRLHALITTKKDATRLEHLDTAEMDIRYEPIQAALIPQTPIQDWLASMLQQYELGKNSR